MFDSNLARKGKEREKRLATERFGRKWTVQINGICFHGHRCGDDEWLSNPFYEVTSTILNYSVFALSEYHRYKLSFAS